MRELWLVDIERKRIEQRVLAEGGAWRTVGNFTGAAPIGASVFAGLAIVPAEIFPE